MKDIRKSVTPLGAARVNRTIFHNHSVPDTVCITLIEGRNLLSAILIYDMVNRTCIEGGNSKHDIIRNWW